MLVLTNASTWIYCHVLAFEHFGGVPAVVVRCAFAVEGDSTLNRSYVELARYCGFLVDPAPPRGPREVAAQRRSRYAIRCHPKAVRYRQCTSPGQRDKEAGSTVAEGVSCRFCRLQDAPAFDSTQLQMRTQRQDLASRQRARRLCSSVGRSAGGRSPTKTISTHNLGPNVRQIHRTLGQPRSVAITALLLRLSFWLPRMLVVFCSHGTTGTSELAHAAGCCSYV